MERNCIEQYMTQYIEDFKKVFEDFGAPVDAEKVQCAENKRREAIQEVLNNGIDVGGIQASVIPIKDIVHMPSGNDKIAEGYYLLSDEKKERLYSTSHLGDTEKRLAKEQSEKSVKSNKHNVERE